VLLVEVVRIYEFEMNLWQKYVEEVVRRKAGKTAKK